MPDHAPHGGFSRREFLIGLSAAAATPSVFSPSPGEPAQEGSGSPVLGPDPVALTLEVNGNLRKVQVEPRATLLDLLRNQLRLTGAKEGCGQGACGSCTVLLDGRPVNACLVLALEVEGRKVETIEALSKGEELHPLQQAFVDEDALQCGYCTPGMILSARACLEKNPAAGPAEIRRALSGNLCRCGSFPGVFRAVSKAGHRMRKGG